MDGKICWKAIKDLTEHSEEKTGRKLRKESRRMKHKRGRGWIAIGVILLIMVAVLCAPATVPRALGYQIYVAVSDDMAPGVTAGSLVLVKTTAGSELEEGDQVAYYSSDGSGVILQRVVENKTEESVLTARSEGKDDSEDQEVSYTQILGKLDAVVPGLGDYVSLTASNIGLAVTGGMTFAAFLFIAIGCFRGRKSKGGRRL